MPIEINEPFHALVPEGATIGIAGIKGSGKGALLKSIAERNPGCRLIGLGDALNFSPAPVLLLDAALACADPLVKARAVFSIERLRRAGTTVFLVSHDESLLERLADEVWWLNDGKLAARGNPRETLAQYRDFIARKLSEWGRSLSEPVDLSTRRGDQAAEIVALETIDFAGAPSMILKSGEPATIRVVVAFREAVENPVIGVMIRTRVGFEVYGTNTELERAAIGPQQPGAQVELAFRFQCGLCPGDYTVTAACHDPDGTAHDWLDDAIAFTVTDARYTAGVANLRAAVTVQGK